MNEQDYIQSLKRQIGEKDKLIVEAAQTGRKIGLAEAKAALNGEYDCNCGENPAIIMEDPELKNHLPECQWAWAERWMTHFIELAKKEWTP